MKRLAVLLDGGFVKQKLKQKLDRPPVASDLNAFVQEVLQLIPEHELFRVYYYDASPYDSTVHNPIDKTCTNYKTTVKFKDSKTLLEHADVLPNFAVRLGECVMQGWELSHEIVEKWKGLPRSQSHEVTPSDLRPKIKQRGVDMRIGLDIAHITNQKLIESVCLVTGDSDFIPAMKYARRGGLRIYLHTMKHGVYQDLKKHADIVIG